jgi:hypothetical protein
MLTETNLIELTLPDCYACPLIYGDETGLEDNELESFNEFCNNELQGLHCLDVKDDSTFVKYHDASKYCLATDCSTFTFMELNSDYAN